MPVTIVMITFFISIATAKAANAASILGFPINSKEPDLEELFLELTNNDVN